jgi:hypothetical protein
VPIDIIGGLLLWVMDRSGHPFFVGGRDMGPKRGPFLEYANPHRDIMQIRRQEPFVPEVVDQ